MFFWVIVFFKCFHYNHLFVLMSTGMCKFICPEHNESIRYVGSFRDKPVSQDSLAYIHL